ncbi:ankyrin repeat-containing domain protein [Mycena albidolilacea]|uniref:Ankyrin repeat-containing domain protein n=1 Tax=Mycena albidolilacea TaxID=1033008 RepID=A0AAD7A0G4_9AGAR|nr:ankyrin repeat-containing domain protein [Mycena albidolilacea]
MHQRAQVGKIVESVPFIGPIGAILSTFVDVYKDVEENSSKRDVLVEKAAALARDIFQAIIRLKNLDHVDLIGRLGSDLEAYLGLIREVQNRVTETFDDRGELARVLKRGELGEEVDSLDDKLSFWGTRFRNNRLVDIQIEQNVVAGNVRKTLETMLDARLEKWLNAPIQNEKQSRYSGVRNRSPCRWFFDHRAYTSWQDHPGEVLWIEGASGTGKTILSSMIIELLFEDRASLKSIDSTAIAYFYFDLGQQSVESALRRLLLQLSHQSSAACKALTQQYDLCNGQTVPNYSTLLGILEKMLAIFGRTYLVLDALDECRTEDYDRVTNFVATARDVFEKKLLSLRSLTRVTPHKTSISDDIRLYISNELVSSNKSAGMFRLAYCLLEQVKECARSDELQSTLDTLPDNLHDIYARSLKSVPGKNLPDVERLLHWLAFSHKPLTVAQLEDTIAFDFSDPERYTFDPRRRPKRGVFIKWLSVLVSVTIRSKDSVLDADGVYRGDATVGLAHSSVQDYLQQHPTWCNSCPIHVREDMAHKLMAQTCVCHLLHFTDHPLARGTIPDHPLATYAAQNWCYHLLRSSDRDRTALSTLAKQLLVGSGQDTVLWFYPESLLYMCARLGYIEGVKFLLEAGADIDERGTALHYAAACKHMKIVEVLLEHGTDINVRDDIFGMTVLQTASKNGSIEMVRLLLQNGADINARDRDLHTTVWADPWRGVNRHLEIVRRLAKNGAYVNAQGDTALQFASANGHLEIVRFLLENGADVGSALQCASENGYIEIVRLLLENGADVNAQAGGRSALHFASKGGYIEIIRLLLENGANINAQRGGSGWTALQCASKDGDIEIVRLLLENDADVNARNGENETALHYASEEGYIEIVQLLVDNGATTE